MIVRNILLSLVMMTSVIAQAQEQGPWTSSSQFSREGTFPVLSVKMEEVVKSSKGNPTTIKATELNVAEDFFYYKSSENNNIIDFKQNIQSQYSDKADNFSIFNTYAVAEFQIYELRNRMMLNDMIRKTGASSPSSQSPLNVESELKIHYPSEKHAVKVKKGKKGQKIILINKVEVGRVQFSDIELPQKFARSFWKGIAQNQFINPHFIDYLLEQKYFPSAFTIPASPRLSDKEGGKNKTVTLKFPSFQLKEITYPLSKGKPLKLEDEWIFSLSPSGTRLRALAIAQYQKALDEAPSLEERVKTALDNWDKGEQFQAFLEALATHSHHCAEGTFTPRRTELCNATLSVVRAPIKEEIIQRFLQALSPKPEEAEAAVRTLLSYREAAGDSGYWIDIYVANTLVTHAKQIKSWNMEGLEEERR